MVADIPVKLWVALVAPDMFVHDPVPVGDDCHWKVIPDATVYPDAVSVNGVLPAP